MQDEYIKKTETLFYKVSIELRDFTKFLKPVNFDIAVCVYQILIPIR